MWVNYHVALIKQLCGSAVEPLLSSMAKVLAKIWKTSVGEVLFTLLQETYQHAHYRFQRIWKHRTKILENVVLSNDQV